ncbi:MAG: beta-L-arabinofuranosidase domain-containing protein, partial [Acidobacteriota bacterium]
MALWRRPKERGACAPVEVMQETRIGRGRKALSELPPATVKIDDGFWTPRREQVRNVTLPDQFKQLETHHQLDNFRVTAGEREGVQRGMFFLDSDLYKWLEAASYQLGEHPQDKELRDRVDEAVRLIGKAQAPDGYINTFYQTLAPERRSTNLWVFHELYCAGHLIEAAVAHKQATGSDSLLGAAVKFADLIERTFGPGKNEGVPGHEEIELALIRLYRLTGEKRRLDLASFFIHRRGHIKNSTAEFIR